MRAIIGLWIDLLLLIPSATAAQGISAQASYDLAMQQIKDGHYVPGMREFADDLRAGSHLTGKRRLGGDELPVSVADAGPGDCYGALHMAT